MKKLQKEFNKGMSTLEILLAFAILILTITAVIGMGFGNQSITVDAETNTEALSKAAGILEDARASTTKDFFSIISKSFSVDSIYTKNLTVEDLTPCKKQATSTITWKTDGGRNQTIELGTFLTDVAGTLALGGDCAINPSEKKWDDPQRFAFDTLSPGKSTAIDVLDKYAYVGFDKKPYLAIADTRLAVLNPNNKQNFFVTFANNFNSDGQSIDQINDIDVYKNNISGKIYAVVALASSTAQFGILEVTDPLNPKLLATRQLSGVNPLGSQPNGYRIYYYQNTAYIVTKETSGPEFHIFDLSTPTNPTEVGTGTKLTACTPPNGTTINDLVVQNNIVYMAAEKANCELIVYDISNPAAPKYLNGASVNLPGTEDGFSLFILGSKLYFGRQSTPSGPEVYVFNIQNSLIQSGGVPQIGNPKEIGTDILDLYVIGKFGFLVTSKTKEEFQIYNFFQLTNIQLIKKYNFGNIVAGGMDYENDFVYATGDATPNFQILYSPS
jgi:hypothetical protein